MVKNSNAQRVAVVTGAAQGIGLAIAQELARHGFSVALGDLDAQAARVAAEKIGRNAIGLPLDVSEPESFQSFLDRATQDLGAIDLVVNNAGVMWVGSFDEEPDSALHLQLNVNLRGAILGVKLSAQTMRERGRGQIITIASAASLLATPGEATYAATKHGVLGYLKAVRAELKGSGVTISVIMPTVVDTKLAAGTSSGSAKLLTAEDVAQVVAKTVGKRKFEVTLPGYVGPLTRLINILPLPVRDRLFAALVPDQVRDTDRSARSDYESKF
ncbi:SDR family oxidoreductase [Microbacterium sp. YY-01]|uniref:SDR family oxidoreductase n=1 Tax=Microbacterium sp. YY-01 TaxID=3421634 RepID=UPI003D17BDDC